MIMAYTVAVSGSGDVTAAAVDDTLTDTLRASELEIQFLVPASDRRLTAGVQAAVEWAWEHDVRVIAYHDGKSSGEILNGFLSDGADEVRERKIINEEIAGDLAAALPFAALFVIMADEEDAETLELVRMCHDAEVPVFDLARGLIELDPFNLDDPETEVVADESSREEDPVEAHTEADSTQTDTAALESGWSPVDNALADEIRSADPPSVSEGALKKLEQHAEKMAQISAETLDMVKEIRQVVNVRKTATPARPRQLVSRDGGETWVPRGRGRLPANVLTKPVPPGWS